MSLWVITSAATHLSSNAIKACGREGADMGVSHGTRQDNSSGLQAAWRFPPT